ncbi:hypothetical protein [Nocardioides limicola]|uniref:hypothetical protein n=1 Tax=Nocardioides limicola TaxID=2803368 RepID=UPI00193B7A49|nr:hypothetical protein [Nocardioides sp. DJM-14]
MSSSQLTPTEELLMIKVGMVAFAVVVGSIFTVATWHKALDWLVAHQVLVTAAESPLVTLPAGDGVGLDASRLAIAAAAAVFAVVSGVAALRRHFAAAGKEQLT